MAYSRRRTPVATNGDAGVSPQAGSYGDSSRENGGCGMMAMMNPMMARMMGAMGCGNIGAAKSAPAGGLWKPDYGGRGAVLDQVQRWQEFAKSWKPEDKENRRKGFCKWCEKGECWDHGQVSKPAKEIGDDSEAPAKKQ